MSYAWLKGAPTVYASDQAISDCLKLAELAPGETLLDLGCGDARSLIIAAREFKAKGVGVEASLYCYLLARWRVWRAGHHKQITIVWRSIPNALDLTRSADVIYVYLYPKIMADLEKPLLDTMSPGSRLVSLSFPLPRRRPGKISSTITLKRPTTIYLYRHHHRAGAA